MCGIAGGFNLIPELTNRMVEQMKHRGPDGSGFYHDQGFSMGMARLSIVDAHKGQQPFVSSCGNYQVIFNGEIYNWRELRQSLDALGHSFQTNCDGEVLPAGWAQWGEQLFPKLNGMFSIAIYDVRAQELILARDHCGQKPLYYAYRNQDFTFASEIRALRKAGISLSPNSSALPAYLLNRYVSEPETLYQEVKVLPAAHWARINDSGTITQHRYWSPDQDIQPSQLKLEESLEQLEAIAKRSVNNTLQKDWKSAIYLSSGVDSNLLASYCGEHGGNISSIALGFNSPKDETKYAAESAKVFELEHHTVTLESRSLEDLPRVVEQMERPVGDALILAFDALASKTKEIGAKVAYGAEGIDEHFGGYSFHHAYLKAKKLGSFGRWGAQNFLKFTPDSVIDRLANFPASLGQEGKQRIQNYLKNFSEFSAEWRADYLRYLYEPSELSAVMTGNLPDLSGKKHDWDVNQLLARQYQSWLQDWSLIRQDKNTMAHSIEYRSPFLDPSMIRLAFNTNPDWKINRNSGKWVWRKLAERRLPSEIAWRPKIPFYLPLEEDSWRKKLVSMSQDILTAEALSKHNLINLSEVKRLQQKTDFLPLKKLSALIIFQIWFDSIM